MGRAGDQQEQDLAIALQQLAGFAPRSDSTPPPHFALRAAEMAAKAVFTVYRVGELARPIHSAQRRDLYMLADERKPDGRPGRQNSLFCSPTLSAAYSWMRAAADRSGIFSEDELPVWMLQCRDELPWVYPVSAWERVERSQQLLGEGRGTLEDRDRSIRSYWDSGMPLSQWCASGRERLPASESEILVAPYQVVEAIALANPYWQILV